jgi:hypothetical protein
MNTKSTYEVERIVDHKLGHKGQMKYLLKWKGFPEDENTWEREANLCCPELLAAYWRAHREQPAPAAEREAAAKARPHRPAVEIVAGGAGPDGRIAFMARIDGGEIAIYENSYLKERYPEALANYYLQHMDIVPTFNVVLERGAENSKA